jgi:hypothetical protein
MHQLYIATKTCLANMLTIYRITWIGLWFLRYCNNLLNIPAIWTNVSTTLGNYLATENTCFVSLRISLLSRYSDWLRARRPKGRSSSPSRVNNFLSLTSPRPALWSTQPPIQWVPGNLFPGVKRTGRQADHSPPTCAEVKKMWIYTFTPPYSLMASA